jgi:hypothetical protein
MREVISIHIGQAGVQTGARFLVLVFLACGRMRRFSFSLSLSLTFFFLLLSWEMMTTTTTTKLTSLNVLC